MSDTAAAKIDDATVAYLNATWLDDSCINANAVTLTTYPATNSNSYLTYAYPYWGGYYYTERIRLTLSDVEHLRKCAKKDAKLKAALQKIAPHIEVEIDFP